MRREGAYKTKVYLLLATPEQAEGRLPFPDPQLSFAEMAELADVIARPASGWRTCSPP